MPSASYAISVEPFDASTVGEDPAAPQSRRCPGCGQSYPDNLFCADCVTCNRCHDTVPEAETVETVRGSTICVSCRRSWYWQCESCDGWNRDGNSCANGCCDSDCDCPDCRDDDDDFQDLVHDYSYKPQPVFHGTGPLFIGPEIEIETPVAGERECAEIADSYLGGLGYLKQDSSIGCGFEIVTHPMSYEWAIANFPWQMLDELRESGCAATDRTGMHIHVSRAGFNSPCHIYRWMKFIYRNEPHVTAVARRCSEEWAAFTDDDRRAAKDYAKGARSNRYRAINTGNRDTFELRIFASSLDQREVKAAFAFAAASVEYTRHLSFAKVANGGGWNWSSFVAWLVEQPAYEPLTGQLEELQCVC